MAVIKNLRQVLKFNYEKTITHFNSVYGERFKDEEIILMNGDHLYIPARKTELPEVMLMVKEAEKAIVVSFSNESEDFYYQATLEAKTLSVSFKEGRLTLKDKHNKVDLNLNGADKELSSAYAMLISAFITQFLL